MLSDKAMRTAVEPWADAVALARRLLIQSMPYLRSVLTVGVATVICALINQRLEVPNLSLIFLIGVLICAISSGLGPSLFASALSVLVYDFFFLPPLYSLSISDPADAISLVAFLISAVLASNLAAHMRRQAWIAEDRAKTMAELHSYSGKLAGIARLDDLGRAATRQIATMLEVDVALLLPEGDGLALRFSHPPADALSDADLAAARLAWRDHGPGKRGSAQPQSSRQWLVPLRTEGASIGLLAIGRDGQPPMLAPDQRRLLDALANQTAVALERIRFAESIDQARLIAETERLRAALLRSISHDLRTPLSLILGAITGLRAYGAAYDRAARDELMATVQEEAERLNRFVGNLLDMTRLESGALELKRSLIDLDEIVGTTLRRSAKLLARHRIEVDLAPDLPALYLDFVLFEQVLVNLLDNAAKYAPAGSTIEIRGRRVDRHAVLEILDAGTGIPPADLERIFDQFFRVRAGDRQGAGTGLGLSICRGFVEALGGRIVAGNRPRRTGAVLTVTLPLPAEPASAPLTADARGRPRDALSKLAPG
jgi:two-component system sensor histidine kinase KdpD